MRPAAATGARAVLLAGPTVLAFFSGGYFDEPRAWAGLVAWILVGIAAVVARPLLPRNRGGRIAVAGLLLFALWALASATWAPLAGAAYHQGQIVMLYAGGLIAAAALLHEEGAIRAVEPAVAGGILVIVGYGISERLVPGVLHFTHSISAQGRLEQPLTYWNAMGEVAAIGLVLCTRLAGDGGRGLRLRLLATVAAVPIGLGLYLSFSRGALFAGAAGLITLAVIAPWREQLRSGAVAVAAAVLAAAAAAPFHGVTSLAGAQSTRETQGLVVLVALVVIAGAGALGQRWLIRGERSQRLTLPRGAPVVALAAITAGLALAIVVGAKEKSTRPLSGGASRFETLQSNRYAYWRVAMRAFRAEPLRGVGAGGWAVYWLRYRPIDEFAQDAHSLPLQTLGELGLIGLGLLGMFLIGVALAARGAARASPALAAGPIAGCVAYIAHAPLDWDWEMPAVTLLALLLAGALIAVADRGPEAA